MFRRRASWQALTVQVHQAAKPDTLTIVDVPEGAENAGVRSSEVTIKLVWWHGSTCTENLVGGPARVASVREQKQLQLRHNAEIIVSRYR